MGIEFNVAQLLKSAVGVVRRYDVDAPPPPIDEHPTTRPVRGRIKLTRTNRGVLVAAEVHTAVRLQCSRCLEETVVPLELRIREEFLPTVDVATGLPLPPSGDDGLAESFTIDEHHILDLGEAVRQYALLELPLQPLCRPDCAGLCPRCGRNLNHGPCGCVAEPADSRLAVLGRLLRSPDERPVDETPVAEE